MQTHKMKNRQGEGKMKKNENVKIIYEYGVVDLKQILAGLLKEEFIKQLNNNQ